MRWPEGPPHLAPNPPYLLFVFCCFCCFCCFGFVCFLGGFKGQMRWPKGQPHLALNPPYLFIFIIVFVFCSCPFFDFNCQNLVFPSKEGIFVYFLCFSFLLPQPFLTSPFSVFLSLSLSCSCLSFFLLVFLVCFLFVSCFCFFFFILLSSLLLFSEKNNIKLLKLQFLFFINSFLFFMVSCLVFSVQIPFPYLCFFPGFKLCLLFNMNVLGFKTNNLKNTNFGQKGGCNKTLFY